MRPSTGSARADRRIAAEAAPTDSRKASAKAKPAAKRPRSASAPLRLLFATPEIAPWVKTGGLGDVCAALPRALAALGVDVRLLLPCYPALLAQFAERRPVAAIGPAGALPAAQLSEARLPWGAPLYLLECAPFYERPGGPYQSPEGRDWPDNDLRFGLLSRTAAWLASGASALDWHPEVLHCHDWQAALAPAYLRYRLPAAARTVVTVHNLAFQGLFPFAALARLDLPTEAFTFDALEFHGRMSFLKGGLQFAERITTVSPTYAKEITGPEQGCGLDGLLRYRAGVLSGILNGIDRDEWHPSRDRLIPARYDRGHLARKAPNRADLAQRLGLAGEGPILGMVSRLTGQKGCDLVLEAADALLARGARLAVLGSGEKDLEAAWLALAARHPGAVGLQVGFDERLAHLIEAGADMFLMPSRFEPCGLNQMYSLAYGTPPIARATGGLADTVVDADEGTSERPANGFTFGPATPQALLQAVDRALALWREPARWRELQRNGMALDFGWERSARQYLQLYRELRKS